MLFFVLATDSARPTLTSPETDSIDFFGSWFWILLPLHPTPAGRVPVGSKIDLARPIDNPILMKCREK